MLNRLPRLLQLSARPCLWLNHTSIYFGASVVCQCEQTDIRYLLVIRKQRRLRGTRTASLFTDNATGGDVAHHGYRRSYVSLSRAEGTRTPFLEDLTSNCAHSWTGLPGSFLMSPISHPAEKLSPVIIGRHLSAMHCCRSFCL